MTNCGLDAAGAGAATGTAAGRGAAVAVSTSRLTMRPPGPVPWSSRRSTPDWAATLRARGEALILPSRPGVWADCPADMGTTMFVAGADLYDSMAGSGPGWAVDGAALWAGAGAAGAGRGGGAV